LPGEQWRRTVEPTERNRRIWDEIHRSRAAAVEGQLGIPDAIREHLRDVSGKHVLHFQCGTGEATAQLVELGALITAVDDSAEAIEAARELAPDVAYLVGDVQALPIELRRGRFDLVYAGGGVLERFEDPDAWAVGVASALRGGGALVFHDHHPISWSVDDSLRWRGDYFGDESPPGLARIVTAVIDAGLHLRLLGEYPSSTLYPWLHQTPHVPREFLLIADKP
jgi:SAM-dependent methyltransferase